MQKKKYHLVTKRVIELYKPRTFSKYLDRYGTDVCIAKIDYDSISKFYEKNKKKIETEKIDFTVTELFESKVQLDQTVLDDIKLKGLFNWILLELNLHNDINVAGTIGKLCKVLNVTPIKLFNMIHKSDLKIKNAK